MLIAYILVTAAVLGAAVFACLAGAARALGPFKAANLHHLAQSLIPIAGCGVFLGLSATTLTQLKADGLSLGFVSPLRVALLVGASWWSVSLAWSVTGLYARSVVARAAGTAAVGAAVALQRLQLGPDVLDLVSAPPVGFNSPAHSSPFCGRPRSAPIAPATSSLPR